MLVIVGLFSRAGVAGEVTVSTRIIYETADGIYLNAGTDYGLSQGLVGSLALDDGRTFEFEVLHVARQTALLRLRGAPGGESLLGRTIELAFQPAPAEASDESAPAKETDGKTPGPSGATAEFVPLLTPGKHAPQSTGPRNVSHGRVQVRQTLQTDSDSDREYLVTRMNTSGSVERISGTPWSFTWAGNLRYRSGDGYRDHSQYQDPHVDLYEAMLQRSLADGGFLRFGRFVPRELPGIGPVDGLQGELHPGGRLRFGAVAGLKPSRIDLEVSTMEPLAAAYTTFEAGKRDRAYYSGTFGLLGSMFDGETNRLALLADQRAGLGPNLTLYSTAQVDFDIGTAQTRSGTRLTRLNAYVVRRVTSSIRLRGGVDHWERPDNPAERDLLLVNDDRFFGNGYWRYWIGSSQNLFKTLRLSQEIAYITSDSVDGDIRWRVGATKTGFFGLPDASMTLTLYNLVGAVADGYGARISGYLPLLDRKWFVQPSAGFRLLEADPQADDFTLTYLSLRLDGRLSKKWSVQGGGTYTFGDSVDSSLFELGVRYSW